MCLRLHSAAQPVDGAAEEYHAIATQRAAHPRSIRGDLIRAAELARYRDRVTSAVIARVGRVLRDAIQPAPEMDAAAIELVRSEIMLLHPQWAVNTIRTFLNLWCTSHLGAALRKYAAYNTARAQGVFNL